MRLVIITQDEPFYLASNIEYLLDNLPDFVLIDSFFLLKHSPTVGQKRSFLKIFSIIYTFGFSFFFHYCLKYINTLIFGKSLKKTLKKNNISFKSIVSNINSEEHLAYLRDNEIDLVISILGSQIFKKPFIGTPKLGVINLHTSLLPKYRGVMPTFWVLKNKEKYTGVSVFFVNEGIDSGKIIVQKKILIGGMSQSELIKRTKRIGVELILESLIRINKGNFILLENEDPKSTYYGFPTRNDVIEFKKAGAKFY